MIERRQEHLNNLERIRLSLVAISGESKEVLSRCPLRVWTLQSGISLGRDHEVNSTKLS